MVSESGCSERKAWRRLWTWEEAGLDDRLPTNPLSSLAKAEKPRQETVGLDGMTVQTLGGRKATGPSSIGRRETGSKHTLLVCQTGVTLAIHEAGPNARDHRQILSVVCERPQVG